MDINERYTKLCAELGHLQMQSDAISKRAAAVRAELEVLSRLASELRAAPQGVPNVTPVSPAPVDD